MARERNDSGRYVETVRHEDVLNTFDAVDGPVITSTDVAEQLDCTTEAARQKLKRLVEDGVLDRRRTGRTFVYWRVEDGETTIDDPASLIADSLSSEVDPAEALEELDELRQSIENDDQETSMDTD